MLLRLDGLPGLSSLIDPMDHQLSCTAARTSRLRAPADIADGLRLAPGGQVCVRRCLWAADGEPAAVVTTYVPDDYCHLLTGPLALPGKGNLAGPSPLASALDGGMSPGAVPGLTLHPGAVRIELQAPGASAARRLRLATGAPAVLVTARLDRAAGIWGDARADAPGRAPHASPRPNPDAGPAPVALTVLVLRPDVFRIVLHT
jgi:hypothetical protein